MKQSLKTSFVVLLAIMLASVTPPIIRRAWAASCPAGSVCLQFPTVWSTFTYIVMGGKKARGDYTRWIDNWMEAPEAGIACSGGADSAPALQAAVNTMPNGGQLEFPIGCQVFLSTTITIKDRFNITIKSQQTPSNQHYESPRFLMTGASGRAMFDFEQSVGPRIEGFSFTTSGATRPSAFLKFDGNPDGRSYGTGGIIRNNNFNLQSPDNTHVAVAISPTAVSNHENYLIENNDFHCSNSFGAKRSAAGSITSGSPNLSASGSHFVAGDTGKRLRVSYQGGILDTRISSVTDGNNVVMAANAASTQTGATVHVDQAFGTGVLIGDSSNAKQEIFRRNIFTQCARGIDMEGGSFFVDGQTGSYNDVMFYVKNAVDPSSIHAYSSEHDMRLFEAVQGQAQRVRITDSRLVTDNAEADGFFYLATGTQLLISTSGAVSGLPTNAFLFGYASGRPSILSTLNDYGPLTWTQVNYAPAMGFGPSSQNAHSIVSLGDTWASSAPSNAIMPGNFMMPVLAGSASAPGAGAVKTEVVCGTNRGTAKIIAYAGTSNTPTTVLDNIGSGVAGC